MTLLNFSALEKAKAQDPNTAEYVRKNFIPGIRCNRCGSPVLRSEAVERGYSYQCMNCSEDLYTIETHSSKREITDEETADLVEDTKRFLCLDKEVI